MGEFDKLNWNFYVKFIGWLESWWINLNYCRCLKVLMDFSWNSILNMNVRLHCSGVARVEGLKIVRDSRFTRRIPNFYNNHLNLFIENFKNFEIISIDYQKNNIFMAYLFRCINKTCAYILNFSLSTSIDSWVNNVFNLEDS